MARYCVDSRGKIVDGFCTAFDARGRHDGDNSSPQMNHYHSSLKSGNDSAPQVTLDEFGRGYGPASTDVIHHFRAILAPQAISCQLVLEVSPAPPSRSPVSCWPTVRSPLVW